MIWLLEFFIGLCLYYLIISPRFRVFLKRSIQSWLGKPVNQTPKSTNWEDVTFKKALEAKTTSSIHFTAKTSVLKDKHEVTVKEEDLQRWLKDNPELKVGMK